MVVTVGLWIWHGGMVSNIMMSEEKDGEKERMQALIYWC